MAYTMGLISIDLPPVLRDTAAFNETTRQAATDSNRGAEWRCLVAQSLIVHAFASARLERCGPEHVAWVMLLLRAFHCLEGARGLLTRDADLAAEVLLRVASEIRLHQMIIRQPWEDHLKSGGAQEESRTAPVWESVRARLRAYAAWAIASDLEYVSDRLNDVELEGVFRATRPEEIPSDPKEAALLRFVFGNVEIVSEQEAVLDRQQAKKTLIEDRDRLTGWLADARLLPWPARIASLRGQTRGRVTSNFAQLFHDSATSFASSLKLLSLRHEYAWYARSSRLIHGNTLDLLTWKCFHDPSTHTAILPRSLPNTDDATAWVTDIANALSQVATYLWAMRDHVLLEDGLQAEA